MLLRMNTDKWRRNTRQKQLIFNVIESAGGHPTAENIYLQARKFMPHISQGTIYRNLKTLIEEDKITELNLRGTVSRYEIKKTAHYHFRCEQCGRVIDLSRAVDSRLNKTVEKETGLKIREHQLEFRGLCHVCQSGNNT